MLTNLLPRAVKQLAALVAVGLFAGTFLFSSISAAQELRIYSNLHKTAQDKISEFLTKELSGEIGMPVKSLALSTGELQARILAEAPRIGADVIIQSDWGTIKFAQDGLLLNAEFLDE